MSTDVNTSAQDLLQHSQRLELIGTVASGIAHDFNNQLTIILNYLDLSLRILESQHPARQALEDVQVAARRCVEMTERLLHFSRRSRTRYQPIRISGLIEETEHLLRRVLPSNIEVLIGCSAGVSAVLADATQIQQVLVNLSVNARDAMPDGGRLEIHVRNSPDGVEITVADTGCGIPATMRERIFEPFFTTKDDRGGTGLGLAMAASIIENHGGAIEVDSEPGRGTTFRIVLPAIALSADASAGGDIAGGVNSRSLCVLIADDDDLVRGVAATVLKLKGYRVIEASDGAEAVRLYRAHTGEIDALLLDIVMPRLSGVDAFAQLREEHPDVKALFTSGHSLPVTEPFLAKPYKPEDLTRMILALIES